jgi:RNA polymerase sigma-70 factor (ECF subfamily)
MKIFRYGEQDRPVLGFRLGSRAGPKPLLRPSEEVSLRALDGATEPELLDRLRRGDEAAFDRLVDSLHGPLLAFARTFTRSPSLAEDIVQETWMGVVRGLDGFEGRASLRTWIFGILVRRARTLTARESRRDLAPLGPGEAGPEGPEWEPGAGRKGLWDKAPEPWTGLDPGQIYEAVEALQVVRAALEALPEAQRQSVLLRDVEGLSTEEVCNILGLAETNLRVQLHRGRARVRRALDAYARDGSRPQATAGPAAPQSAGRERAS